MLDSEERYREPNWKGAEVLVFVDELWERWGETGREGSGACWRRLLDVGGGDWNGGALVKSERVDNSGGEDGAVEVSVIFCR